MLTECRYAQSIGKPIIALEIRLALITIPTDLSTVQRINFYTDYMQGLQKLLRELSHIIPPATPPSPAAHPQIQRGSTQSNTNTSSASGPAFLVFLIIAGIIGYEAFFPAYNKGDTIDGISCNATDQSSMHYHAHLQIYVNGLQTSIPDNVGRQSITGCSYWLHTQSGTGDEGVIHIESPDNQTFTLHQFFDIWGQQLSATNLMGNQVDATHKLTVYVYNPNQRPKSSTQPFTVTPPRGLAPYLDDPTKITFKPHELLVLEYGTPLVKPSAWTFLASE